MRNLKVASHSPGTLLTLTPQIGEEHAHHFWKETEKGQDWSRFQILSYPLPKPPVAILVKPRK